jgi:predicted metal-dependent hydrolase
LGGKAQSAAEEHQRMTRKWGSCSLSGTISLAEDLALQPTGFQDFVVVHELLHMRIPNHGRVFKALMTAHVPEWRRHDLIRRTSNDRHASRAYK